MRSQFLITLALAMVLSTEGQAQLSTRENAGTVYRQYNNGIPDSMFTWLASDVDVPPEFPGGQAGLVAYFAENAGADPIPDEQCRKNAEVLIWVIVERDGTVDTAWIDRGGCPALQQRTLGAVHRMPLWLPGLREGRAVRTRVRIPVSYGYQ